jgi:hypothetical protein
MADELLTFEHTTAVLQQLADEVKGRYIEELKRNDHVTKFGKDRLIDTITTVVTIDGKSFTASLKMNHYWKYLEEGIQPAGKYNNPGWKSFPFILNWVQIKPVIPRPPQTIKPSKRTLESLQKSAAGAIVYKRNLEGDPGTHGFETARDAILPVYYERIKDALTEDIGDYILKVFNW